MPTANFDIYEAGDTYMAVTNEVRRQILAALEDGDRQLPDLVDLTERSKSTLSSIHVRELIEQGLVEEQPHPDDSRKKVYRLAGRKIGSSNVPLEQLREAVKEYVSVAPEAARFPLSVTFDALAAAPDDTEEESLATQARRLGTLVGQLLETSEGRELLIEISHVLEQEGLAEPVRLDMEGRNTLVLRRGDSAPRGSSIERVALLVGGFVEGILADEAGKRAVSVDVEGEDQFLLSVEA